MMSMHVSILTYFAAFTYVAAASQLSAGDLAAQYSLTTSTAFPFPTSTMASQDAQQMIVSQWSLGKGRIQDGAQNIAFVNDPFPNDPPTGKPGETVPSGPVLQVTYPAGSFSHDTGGSQMYNLWNTSDGSTFGTMMVSYEVAFNKNFDWVQGGKLPGLRGGFNSTGCSGGNAADGQDCFSTRVMWRKSGDGEVYAYIPMPNGLCSEKDTICNSDFGISMSRGSFGFVSGKWNRVTMLVRLNDPPSVANGVVQLYYNDLLAISRTDLQIRSSPTLFANGLFFSTFFGGADKSWATPTEQHTYYRGIQLWGSSLLSNLTGEPIKNWSRKNSPIDIPITLVVFLLIVGLLVA